MTASRKRRSQRKRRIIGMWLSPADFALVEQVAARRGVSLAGLVRDIALPLILDLAAPQAPISAPGLAELAEETRTVTQNETPRQAAHVGRGGGLEAIHR